MEAHTTPPTEPPDPDNEHEFEEFDGWGGRGDHDFDIRDTIDNSELH
ncbi:hypothetical protein BLA23254_06934 [Burkholderia lata]|uniref:Uncharacterized protein n=1 Tax=Burkholderia lata (strain ATCC 17760 / DSM 23089 / LMG 22485 / NCIMB 9086 / R18194 / 383) TaxID=482957 RepID=A0A6P2RTS4_BURL3|nr:hypothetical protein [Burkholderia lata]VWC40546.1 hypothetical protein BLA23254_06934 [Burkholderia lata]